MSVVLHFIDILGTFIFALSGAVAGVKKGFDVFGVFAIAVARYYHLHNHKNAGNKIQDKDTAYKK